MGIPGFYQVGDPDMAPHTPQRSSAAGKAVGRLDPTSFPARDRTS
jgi:hypothetical protein